MSNSDDDPIVAKIPVYLNQEMKNQLYLFQYPTTPRNSISEPPQIQKCMVKPQNKQVKMEIAVNPVSSNYDYGKGEHMALNVDGPTPAKEGKIFRSGFLDKTVLKSTCPVPDAGRYAIGVLQNGELHLNPLYTCLEMRNYLPFLDTGDKRAKEVAKSHDGEGDEEELKQITVKFARQESERVKRARERSFNYLSKKSAEEPWYYTEYHPCGSEKSECLQTRLFCPNPEERPMQLSLDVDEYRGLLAPPEALDDAMYGTHETTMRRLRNRPLTERVRHLLRSATVLRFDELMELLDCDEKPLNVVCTLQQVGVLVQGNWVIKSDELYPEDGSYPPGITSESLCQARDYMLLQFTRKLCLPMTELQNGARIPAAELRQIVERIAKMIPSKGWEFKLPADLGFSLRFPEVAQRQRMMWEARMKNM